jgi:hypothetical protein
MPKPPPRTDFAIPVIPGLDPRLSGTLFACVIPGMMDFPPLVVARGNWGGRCFTLAPPEVR